MTKHYAGARIHALRKQRGLTQVAMAKQLGLSTSYLNQLENDQRPLTVTVLMQLAQRFNLDPGYFANDRDARTITDLRRIFPEATEDSLADLASRFPELMPRFVDVATRAPARERSPFKLVRDFSTTPITTFTSSMCWQKSSPASSVTGCYAVAA